MLFAAIICRIKGCDMQSSGGANAGCGPDCACSIPVYECCRCGACDYGQNAEAQDIRAACAEDMEWSDGFTAWLEELRVKVVEEEFGYEPGEFTVFGADWLPMYREGLTPRQAWQRALDAHREAREAEDRAKEENHQRIKAADAAALR